MNYHVYWQNVELTNPNFQMKYSKLDKEIPFILKESKKAKIKFFKLNFQTCGSGFFSSVLFFNEGDLDLDETFSFRFFEIEIIAYIFKIYYALKYFESILFTQEFVKHYLKVNI